MIEAIIYILGIIATVALIWWGELKDYDEITLGQLCLITIVSVIGSWIVFFILIFLYHDKVIYRKNKKKKIDVSE
jgi:uncharacterized BrkB/YihY/UPF0761 family membrane protein